MKQKPPRPPSLPPANPPPDDAPLFPADDQPEAAVTRPRHFYLAKMEQDGLFTGERLREINPALFSLVREKIAENHLSHNQIARYLSVSVNTVRAIARGEAGSIDTIRGKLATLAAELEQSTLERLREMMDDPKAKWTKLELAAVLREVGKRSDALAGRDIAGAIRDGNTARSIDSLAEAAADRRQKLAAIRAKSIDAEVTIHSSARQDAPREAARIAWRMTPSGIVAEPLHCQIVKRGCAT